MQVKLLPSHLEAFVCDANRNLAIIQKSLDRAMYIFIHKAEVRLFDFDADSF